MEKNKLIYSKKNKRKIDSDKYDIRYHVSDEGELYKSVWETHAEVGPGAFNNGHVDEVLFNDANSVRRLTGTDLARYVFIRSLRKDLIKFRP